jgi:ribosomal protein RSM22 (predicted rRNA methylase)
MVYSKLQKNRITIDNMQELIYKYKELNEFTSFDQKDFSKIYSILKMYHGIFTFSEQ